MRSNKTRYFLAELVLNCLFFALSAAICTNLFVAGHVESQANSDISMASIKAQSAAEAFKASNGDEDIYSEIMGGISDGVNIICYYDSDWQLSDSENYSYALYMSSYADTEGLLTATILVTDQSESIYELSVSKYLGGGGSGG